MILRAPQRARPRSAARPSEIQPDATSAGRPSGPSAKPSYQVSGSQMPSSVIARPSPAERPVTNHVKEAMPSGSPSRWCVTADRPREVVSDRSAARQRAQG